MTTTFDPTAPAHCASLRVPCASNFGADFVTLWLRRDGTLTSSAGDITRIAKQGRVRICTIASDYPSIPDAVFVVLESHTLLSLIGGKA